MRKSTKAWHVVLRPALAAAAIAATAAMSAEVPVSYQAELTVNAGGGEFTPYYMTANNHGVLTQSKNALLRASAWKETERDKRFSYGFGIDLVGGWGSRQQHRGKGGEQHCGHSRPCTIEILDTATLRRGEIPRSVSYRRTETARLGAAQSAAVERRPRGERQLTADTRGARRFHRFSGYPLHPRVAADTG